MSGLQPAGLRDADDDADARSARRASWRALDGAPATLIGSSLGGTLAILAADRSPRRSIALVLMAPAVMFAKPGHHLLPPERIEEWRRRGSLPFFHYADNARAALDYAFYEDSLRYDAFNAGVRAAGADLPGAARRVGRLPDRRSVRAARGRTSRCRCSTTIIS